MLSPEQLAKLSEITNPIVRQRFVLFYQLPPDMQESMWPNTAKSIWNLIKEKYHMPEANISTVARIIGLIFLGELPIKNFIAELKNKLNVERSPSPSHRSRYKPKHFPTSKGELNAGAWNR